MNQFQTQFAATLLEHRALLDAPNPKSKMQNQKFLVRWTGNYAVRFHDTAQFGKCFTLVGDKEASLFNNEAEAQAAIAHVPARGGELTIEEYQLKEK